MNCKRNILPFNGLDDNEFLENLLYMSSDLKELYDKCMFIENYVKQYVEGNSNDKSKYITHEQLSSMSTQIQNSFSILHVNCRSLKSNFDDIDNLLHRCRSKLKVIALSETWMCDEKYNNYDSFNFKRYTFHYVNRKKGGGTALFVIDKIKHKCIEEFSYSTKNCFHIVTVEINENESSNFYVSCIYRPPNVCMNKFIGNYTQFIQQQKNKNKKLFICGDFNIGLIKDLNNIDTDKLLNLAYSYSQCPLITAPTRITKNSATAIDNIFTNMLSDNIKSSILIDDITDHLPVFCILSKLNIKQNSASISVKRNVSAKT